MNKCKTCKWFSVAPKLHQHCEGSHGYCHRYPPGPSEIDLVSSEFWCGEWTEDIGEDVPVEAPDEHKLEIVRYNNMALEYGGLAHGIQYRTQTGWKATKSWQEDGLTCIEWGRPKK